MIGYSWPFLFNPKLKKVFAKMDNWVKLVPDKPIILSRDEYDALVATVRKDFIKIGDPVYKGRKILRR